MHSGCFSCAGSIAIENSRHVEQRGGNQFVRDQAGLVQMQAARPSENHRAAGLDRDRLLALLVVIAKFAAQAGQNVGHSELMMRPLVGAGIFEIEHDAGSTRVQHLDAQLGVVGRAGHLVALVAAPVGQRDPPAVARSLGREAVRRLRAFQRRLQHFHALNRQFLLARGERAVQRQKEFHKARGQIAGGIEIGGRAVDRDQQLVGFRSGDCGGCHNFSNSWSIFLGQSLCSRW